MQKIKEALNKISDSLDWAMVGVVFLLVAAMVIVTTLQVVFRVFFNALTWSEELARYLLVWGTFFGATLAYKRGNHIAVTLFVEMLPRKLQRGFRIFSTLLSILFLVVIAYQGVKMIQLQVFQISPALSLPMRNVYLSIPISLSIMVVHALAGVFCELVPERNSAEGRG